jgi:hypothetical protein
VGEAKLAVYSPDPDPAKSPSNRPKKSVPKKAKRLAPRPTPPELPAVERTTWFAIPAEYGDIDHSGLRVTIHAGPNNCDIEMK